MKRASALITIPFVVASVLGAAPVPQSGPLGVPPDSVRGAAVTDHVIVISVDGLRPDAIERFDLHTIQRLMAEGWYADSAQTIFPSKTLPSHTSMLTGRTPEEHGITWNSESDERGNVQVPTIFELARQRGLSTAAFFSKAKFRHLERPDAYDYWQAPAYNADNWLTTRTVVDAVQYLQHHAPNLLFVHIGETDYVGHTMGWMGFFYGRVAGRADAGVARVLEAAEDTYGVGNFTVILTADHGGHDHSHGSDAPEDMTIPWVTWGKGVVAGPPADDVRTMDTAATALWLLGVPVPAEWEGEPVRRAFRSRTLSAEGR